MKKIQEYDRDSLGLPIVPEWLGGSRLTKAYALDPENDLFWECQNNDYIRRVNKSSFFVFHPQQGVVMDLYSRIMPLLSYGELYISDILIDSEHRAWVATSDGAFIIRLRKTSSPLC